MVETGKIKILHIASGDLWAGAEAQLFTLATSLRDISDVTVAAALLNYGTLEKKLRDAGIEVTVLDESELNGFEILRQLAKIIREFQPDVVHTHRSKENILGTMAALLCSNTPSLRTVHGASEHHPPWLHIFKRLIALMDWLCGRYLQARIIAVSADLAEILQRDFPVEKIMVIENGIDVAALARSDEQRETDDAASGHRIRIGIAGRLVPVKRVDLFIKAAAELRQTHPEFDTSFHIFGDGPLRSELAALCREHDTGNVIRFEGHCESMPERLAALDILLITSDHEGLPMILLEAMALKTPVIAHSVGGIPAVLKQGKCGLLVTEQLPSAYVEAITQLINDTELRAKIIREAFRRVSTRYSTDKNAAAYIAVYRTLLAK